MKINKEWLTRTTGDPFADVGGLAIEYLWEKDPNKTILELIEDVTDIYVNKWNGSIHPFFLNSTITQNAFKGERKKIETLKYYSALLNNILSFEDGYCRILGVKTNLFSANRANHILSGSGGLMNFHHSFQTGLMLSKEALIRMFFIPLATEFLADKIALVGSNNRQVVQLFVNDNISTNQNKVGKGISEGILKSSFKNPSNALFDFASICMEKIKEEENDITITLYHFTNFGASPEMQVYALPAIIYKFYQRVTWDNNYKKDWNHFLNRSYRNSKLKKLNYNIDSHSFEYEEKKEVKTTTHNIFKTWYNPILEKLLKNKSILPNILTWVKEHPFNFNIVKLYQIYIKKMNQKTLEKIEQIADFILEEEHEAKKLVTKIKGIENAYALKRLLVSFQEKSHKKGNKEPLFSMQDYVTYLFPEGIFWKDIQLLLLICLYEKMHQRKIFFEESDNQ